MWWGKLKERDLFEDRGIDGNVMLEEMLRKLFYMAVGRTELAYGRDKRAGCCGRGNEHFCSTECEEIFAAK